MDMIIKANTSKLSILKSSSSVIQRIARLYNSDWILFLLLSIIALFSKLFCTTNQRFKMKEHILPQSHPYSLKYQYFNHNCCSKVIPSDTQSVTKYRFTVLKKTWIHSEIFHSNSLFKYTTFERQSLLHCVQMPVMFNLYFCPMF